MKFDCNHKGMSAQAHYLGGSTILETHMGMLHMENFLDFKYLIIL